MAVALFFRRIWQQLSIIGEFLSIKASFKAQILIFGNRFWRILRKFHQNAGFVYFGRRL